MATGKDFKCHSVFGIWDKELRDVIKIAVTTLSLGIVNNGGKLIHFCPKNNGVKVIHP
jgi:hypothetical protein